MTVDSICKSDMKSLELSILAQAGENSFYQVSWPPDKSA